MRKPARVLQRIYAVSIPVLFCFCVLVAFGPFGLAPEWALVAVAAFLSLLAVTVLVLRRERKHMEAQGDRSVVDVAPPVTGEWVAVNSPADKVPSHGTRQLGQKYAIDVFQDSGRPLIDGWWPAMRRPDDGFRAFGEPILAVADATVVRASDGQRDHLSRNSWPGYLYLMLVEAVGRSIGGPHRVLGNHVVLDLGDGVYAAYAHLKRDSVAVGVGDRVTAGQLIGRCGNSGNTSEPHLHFQLMDNPEAAEARGIPFTWSGVGVPPTGEPFTAAPRSR